MRRRGGGEKRMKEGSSSLTMIGGNRIKMQFALVYFAQLFSRAGGHSQEQENRQFRSHFHPEVESGDSW